MEALKLSYFALANSVISYGLIFWGSATNVHKVFIMQKRIVRIITNTKPRVMQEDFQDDGNKDTILTVYILIIFIYSE